MRVQALSVASSYIGTRGSAARTYGGSPPRARAPGPICWALRAARSANASALACSLTRSLARPLTCSWGPKNPWPQITPSSISRPINQCLLVSATSRVDLARIPDAEDAFFERARALTSPSDCPLCNKDARTALVITSQQQQRRDKKRERDNSRGVLILNLLLSQRAPGEPYSSTGDIA